MKREYPFSSNGSPAADVGSISRFPLLDSEAIVEQTVGDQMADPNSLLYFPALHGTRRELNEAVQAAAALAVTFDAVVKDERDEAADFGVFGRVALVALALVALALVELTVSFAEPADLTGHGALVRELHTRLGRVEKQLGLVVDRQCDQLLDSLNN
jgi:hypothetical protein